MREAMTQAAPNRAHTLSPRDLAAYLRGEHAAGRPFTSRGRTIAAGRVSRALATLPYRQARILERRYHERQSVEEVAEAMGTSVSTVVSETATGLDTLAQTLDELARRGPD